MKKTSVNNLKIGQAAKALGVHIDTLRRWEKAGKISSQRTPGGTRLYSLESLQEINPNLKTTDPDLIGAEQAIDQVVEVNPNSTEELLRKSLDDQILPSFPILPEVKEEIAVIHTGLKETVKKTLFTKLLISSAVLSVFTLVLTSLIMASYLTQPKLAKQVFKNNLASALFSPFNSLAESTIATISPKRASELGFKKEDDPPPINSQKLIANNLQDVLAVTASSQYLEINGDTQINGTLSVLNSINNLTIEASPSASTLALTSGNTILNITNSSTIDQNLSTSSSPAFASLDLGSTLSLGAANSTFHSGTGVPASTLGANGDYYFRADGTSGGTSVYYKISGSWIAASPITSIAAGTDISVSSSTGDVTISDTSTLSSVTGRGSTTSTALTLNGAITAGSTLKVSGATTLSSTLAVTGASTLASTLAVTGATTLSSTLDVAGISTLTGNVGIGASLTTTGLTFAQGGLRVNGYSDLTGNVGIGGSLTVAGPAYFGSTVQVQSASTLYSGSGVPSNGIGANGDYYYRTDGTTGNTSIYYKTGGSWISAGGGSLQNAYDVGSSITTTAANGSVSLNLLTGYTHSFALNNAGTGSAFAINDTNSALNLALDVQSNGLTKFSVLDNGNVGIGATASKVNLAVSGNAGIGVSFGYNSVAPVNGLAVQGNVGIGTSTADYNLSVVGTGNFTGNVGIGATTSSNKLDVWGNARIAGNLTVDSVGTLGSGLIGYSGVTGPSSGLAVSGNVGIGATTTSNKLYVNGAGAIGSGYNGYTAPTDGLLVQGNVGIGFTTTSANLTVASQSVTTGKLVDITTLSSNTLTTGTLLNVASTATSLTGTAGTGSLANLSWAPPSSTTATGDLFALSIGANGTTTGNIFNILDSGSSIFSVSESAFTTSLPTNFTGSGDVGIANDLQFTNPVTSFIKSNSGLVIVAGETFGSSTLTLQTYNAGNLILAPATGNLWADGTNVGIGHTNPDYKLRVQGTGFFSGFVGIGSSMSVSGNVGIGGSLTATATNATAAFTNLNVTGTSVLGTGYASTFTSSGNVGIGSSLTTTGLTFASGGLRVNGFSDLTGNVGIGGTATFNSLIRGLSGLTVSGSTNLQALTATNINSSTLTTTGNVGVGGSLTVTSGVNFSSSLNVTGNTQLSTLSTSGNITNSGVFLASDGTASAPGYSFSADTDTGIFRPSTDALGLSTGGTSRLTITAGGNIGIGITNPGGALIINSGNVGIGITTPGVALDVSGAIRTNNNFYVNGGISNITSLNDVANVNKSLGSNSTASWSTGTAGGTARYNHSSVLYNGKIYSWGGLNSGGSRINTVDIYDIASGTWSTGTAGGTARSSHTSVLYNGKIYSWAGLTTAAVNTIDIYDIASDSWSTGTAGGTARRGHTSVLYNGKIYSWAGTGALTSIDIYDIASDSWSTGTSGGTGRGDHTSVLYNGKIYSWGGDNLGLEINSVDIYDIASDSWSTGTSGGTARKDHTSVLYNGKIYSWGGNVSATTVNIYDIATNSWSTGTSSSTNRYSHTSIPYNGKIYSWAGIESGSTSNTVDIYDIGFKQNILSLQENGQDTLSFQTGSQLFLSSGRLGITGGNVGIGTSAGTSITPSQLFQINASINNPFVVTSSGFVGIGTTGPTNRLSVFGSVGIGNTAAGGFANSVAPSNGLAVQGNVGIGTTTANSSLSVAGSAHIGSLYQGIAAPTDGLFVDGNVGIGATTSSNKLDVWGNTRITGTLTVDQGTTFGGNLTLSGHLLPGADDTFDLGSNTARWRDLYLGPATLHIGTSTSDEYSLSYDTTNNRLGFNVNDSGPAEIVFDSNGNVGIGTTSPVQQLQVNLSTNPFVVTSASNVGIGTSLPNAKLSIQGNVGIGYTGANQVIPSNGLAVSGNVGIGTTTANSTLSVSGNAHIGGLFQGIAAPSNGLFVDGNVGIGATTSDNKLDVWGNTRITGTLSLDGNLTTGGTFLASDGSAAAPAFSFSADTDNGMFRPSTNALGFSTGGSSRLTITAGGNVGIGITNPSGVLQINDASSPFIVTSGGSVGIGTTTPSGQLTVLKNNSTVPLTNANSHLVLENTSGSQSFLTFSFNGTPLSGVRADSSGNFNWQTSGSQGHQFYNNISSTSPTTGISVSGVQIGGAAGAVSVNKLDVYGAAAIGYTATFPTAPTNGLLVNGNVGIGFTSPAATLDVIGTSLLRGTGGTYGLAVTSAGLVGVGVTNPLANFAVNGSGLFGYSGTASAPTNGLAVQGNVGIGTTTADYNLSVIGTTNITGNVGVGGSLTTTGLTFASGGLRVNGFSDLTGNVGVGGSLTVTSRTSLGSTLSVTGDTTLTGDLAINGGDLTSTSTTFNLLSTTVSTLNIGDAASTLNLAGGSSSTGCTVDSSGNMTCSGNIAGSSSGTVGFWGRTGTLTYLANFADNVGIGTSTQYGNAKTFIQGAGTSTAITLQTTGSGLGQGLTVLDNGNVGIGTTGPTTKLDVLGTTSAALFSTSVSSPGTAYAVIDLKRTADNTAGSGAYIRALLNDTGSNMTEYGRYGVAIEDPATLAAIGYYSVNLRDGNNALIERFRISGTGNIGIGTSSPNAKLSIQGNVGIGYTGASSVIPSNGLAVSGNVGIGTTTANSSLSVAGNAHIGGLFQGIAAPSNGLFVDGNVGIGATTSDNKLDVWGNTRITGTLSLDGNLTTGGSFLASDGSASAPAFSFSADTDNGMFRPSTNALGFSTGGTSRLSITAGGNVGIGLTNPAGSLIVNSGNVGFGNNAPTQALDVTGSVNISSNLLFTKESAHTIQISDSTTNNTAGSALTIQGAAGLGSGAGGAIAIRGGAPQDAGGTGNGGAITLTAGNASNGNNVSGGAITLTAGNAGASGPSAIGGAISLTAGAAIGNDGAGGGLTLTAGAGGGSSSTGGAISLTTGAGGSSSGASGALTLASGTTTSGNTGALTLRTGAATGGNAGGILFQTNGTNSRMAITPAGFVGIGITNPVGAFQVNGAGAFGYGSIPTSSLPSNGLAISGNVGIGTTTADYNLSVIGTGNFTGNVGVGSSLTVTSLIKADSGLTVAAHSGLATLSTTGNVGIGSSLTVTSGVNFASSLNVAGNTQLSTLNASGNVGIGGTATFSSLAVFNSNLSVTGNILPSANDTYSLGSDSLRWSDVFVGPSTVHIGTSTSDEYAIAYDTTNNRLGFNVNGTGPSEIVFDSSGNVGIGTTGPTSLLHLYKSQDTGTILNIDNPNTGVSAASRLTLTNDASSANVHYFSSNHSVHARDLLITNNDAAGDIKFEFNGGANMVLSQNGNVGIGSSNPGAGLHVGTNGLIGFGEGITAPSNGLAVSGNVGIGTTTANYNLSVIGTGNFTGNVGIGSSLTTTGLTFAQGGLRVNGFSDLTGNVGIGSSLNVTSASVLDSLQVTKSISAATLGVSGATNLNTLNTSGNVGVGSSLTVTSLIKADSGLTVAAGSIFSGALSANNTFTLGDNGDTGSIDTSDWDISTTGVLTGISGITTDGGYTQSGSSANTFSGANTFSANSAALSFTGTTPSITSGSSLFGIFAGGNVGIGTTGNVYGGLTVRGAGTSTGITLQTYGSNLTQGLTALDNGNVGIGTTGPAGLLDISKTLSGAGTLTGPYLSISASTYTASTNGDMAFNSIAAPTLAATGSQTTAYAHTLYIAGNPTAGANQTITHGYGLGVAGNTVIFTGGHGNPGYQPTLHLASNTSAMPILTLEDVDGGTGALAVNVQDTILAGEGSISFKTGMDGTNGPINSGTARLTITGAGFVGIGITSPSQIFQVNSGANSTTINSSGNLGIGATSTSNKLFVAGAAAIGSGYNGYTAPTDGLLVQGNVGIGTTSPRAKLDVSDGTVNTSGEAIYYGLFSGANIAPGSATAMVTIQSTDAMAIDKGGSLAFGGRAVSASAAGANFATIIGAKENGTSANYNGYLAFRVRGNSDGDIERVRINSAGNVGIGFTTPDRLTQIASDINITPTNASLLGAAGSQFAITGNSASGLQKKLVLGIDTTDNYGVIQAGNTSGTNYDLILNPAGGNVGIGFTTPSASLSVNSQSVTTGKLLDVSTLSANTLTTGTLLNVASTATSLTGTAGTGSLANLSWAPPSSTTATGDLFALSIGANGTTTGNLFNILDSGSSIFSVSESAFTTSLPSNFTAAGDVSMAYDLNFTNPTASFIKSAAPLEIVAGETFNSSNLTFRTYNQGNLILAPATGNLWADGTNVGIGTTGPNAKLTINQGTATTQIAGFKGSDIAHGITTLTETDTFGYISKGAGASGALGIFGITEATYGLYLQGISTTASTTKSTAAQAAVMIAALNKSGTTTANLGANENILAIQSGAGDVTQFIFDVEGTGHANDVWTDNAFDLAEDYPVMPGENLEEGDVVRIEKPEGYIKKSDTAYDDRTFGVISYHTAQLSGYADKDSEGNLIGHKPVALIGRVPVKVSLENGPIKTGDFLVASSVPGVAMKGTKFSTVLGKALEDYDGTVKISAGVNNIKKTRTDKDHEDPGAGIGKILVFINVTQADPNNFLANLSLDSEGNVLAPKIKTDKLIISAGVNLTAADIKKYLSYETTTLSNGDTSYAVDIASSLDKLNNQIDTTAAKLAEEATKSAQLAQDIATNSAKLAQTESTTLTLAQQLASAAADLVNQTSSIASLQSDVEDLKLTPPDILYATGSASLANISISSEATVSGKLLAYQLDVQDTFKSLGQAILGNTTIAGNLTVDGTLSIDNGSEINVFPTLYLQKSNLAEKLDIFDGKVTVDKNGKLIAGQVAAAQVTTNKLTITNDQIASGSAQIASDNQTVGSSKIVAGQTEVAVFTKQASSTAKIFITPRNSTAQPLVVKEIVDGSGFVVGISTAPTQDINFDWLLIETQ